MEYQETMNLDIEKIASTSQQFRRSIYEGIRDYYFKAGTLFSTQFLDHCKRKQNESKNILSEVKVALKKMAL